MTLFHTFSQVGVDRWTCWRYCRVLLTMVMSAILSLTSSHLDE